MKKWLKQLGSLALGLAMVCSMLIPTAVQAEEKTGPQVEVTGVPKSVIVGEEITLQIQVTGVEGYEELSYELYGPFREDTITGDITEDGTAKIKVTIENTYEESQDGSIWVKGKKDGEEVDICNKYFSLNITRPKITIISGMPEEPVYAVSPMTIEVKAENLAPNKEYFVTSSLDGHYEEIAIKEGETLTLSGIANQFAGESELSVTLYEVTGDGEWDYEEVASTSEEYTVLDKVQFSVQWNPIKQVIAGTAYPFSVTVKNVSNMDLQDLYVHAYAPGHTVSGWGAKVEYTLQDGVYAEGDNMARIAKLAAGEEITLKGTITFPENGVGDGSYISTSLWDANGDQLAYASSYYDNMGNYIEDGLFQIVAAGSQGDGNQGTSSTDSKGQSQASQETTKQTDTVKTGDAAPTAATVGVMMMAVFAVVLAMKKRQMN